MTTLDLLFGGQTFPVPKRSVIDLLEHRALFEAKNYAVQTSVPVEVFEAFVVSLKTQQKISVTKANAVTLLFLAKEFFLSDLAAECSTFSVPVDQFLSLSDRVTELERQIASFSKFEPSQTQNPLRKLQDKVESQEEGMEHLRLSLERLKRSFEGQLTQLNRCVEQLRPTSKTQLVHPRGHRKQQTARNRFLFRRLLPNILRNRRRLPRARLSFR
jgi:hypothetical protein